MNHRTRLLLATFLLLPGLAIHAQIPGIPGTEPQTPAASKSKAAPARPSLPRPVNPPGFVRPNASVPATNPNAVPPNFPGQNQPGAPPPPLPGANNGPMPAAGGPGAAAGKPPVTAGAPTPPKSESKDENYVAFDAASIEEVLDEYFRITKRRVLKDRGMESSTVTIMAPGVFTDAEYQEVIEIGLLMHGFALVQAGPTLYKLVATETGSSAQQQNVPMILKEDDLPKSDAVVSHVVQLNYISAEEAANTLQSAIPPHPYGKIIAVPNARTLVITEASQTIRAYLELIKQIDLRPNTTEQKTIKLLRTDPEDVAKMLESLLDLKNQGSGTAGGSRPATPAQPAIPRAPAVPGQPAAAQPATAAAPVVTASGGGSTAEGPQPIILPIVRTSSLLITAQRSDMERIEKLIAEIDAEADGTQFISRKLNYIDLKTFLGLAEKAIMRYDKNASGSSALGSTTGNNSTNNSNTNNNTGFSNFNSGGFGNNGLNSGFGGGFGGIGGGGGFGGGGGGLSGGGFKGNITTSAESFVVGRTLVIIDPGSSKFLAAGPPEQLRMLESLADELDVRPRQIFISAIIGSFDLSNDLNFGLDWVRTLSGIGNESGRQAGGLLNTSGTLFDASKLNNLTNTIGTGGLGSLGGFTAYGQIAKNLHVFMRTLETSGRFRVMQKPIITTMNHQPASIYIGQQIAIAGQSFNSGVVGGGFSSTTQYIPVRIQLDITPHIFNDREIMLEFKQQNNSTNGGTTINGNFVPNISEQGMSNSLIVPDRAAVMLGGLIGERQDREKNGLPFLVRLPLIKHIFGNTKNKDARSELMIFVQPMIMPNGGSHINEQNRYLNDSPNSGTLLEFATPEDLPEQSAPQNASPPASNSTQPAVLPGQNAQPQPNTPASQDTRFWDPRTWKFHRQEKK